MIHAALHESGDTVGVAIVEGIKAGMKLNARIMDVEGIFTVSDVGRSARSPRVRAHALLESA